MINFYWNLEINRLANIVFVKMPIYVKIVDLADITKVFSKNSRTPKIGFFMQNKCFPLYSVFRGS